MPGGTGAGGTVRDRIREILREGWANARELSERVGISERAVVEHLPHVEKSAHGGPETLETEPARCLGCGRTFAGRARKSTPSRCPDCKSERIARPRFRLV